MLQRVSSKASMLAAALAVVAVGLVGCSGAHPVSSPSPTPKTSVTATPTASPPLPTFHKDGTAAENLPYFDYINQRVISENTTPVGMDFINALTAAGFDKADMQVTADKTTAGLTPGSIQFSVRFRGECLIGQNGAGSDGYHSEVAPILSTGNCLIGNTVPIP